MKYTSKFCGALDLVRKATQSKDFCSGREICSARIIIIIKKCPLIFVKKKFHHKKKMHQLPSPLDRSIADRRLRQDVA